jgi:hypothetical protein
LFERVSQRAGIEKRQIVFPGFPQRFPVEGGRGFVRTAEVLDAVAEFQINGGGTGGEDLGRIFPVVILGVLRWDFLREDGSTLRPDG